jgi:hypothetical protein
LDRVTFELIASGASVDWAGLALAAGYCDQAHLAHEFHDFAGLSPSAYLASPSPSGSFLYFHLFRILLGLTFPRTYDALWRLIFWMQRLPGAILGVGVWLIDRLTITPYRSSQKQKKPAYIAALKCPDYGVGRSVRRQQDWNCCLMI